MIRPAANLTQLWTELDDAARFRAAAGHGFTAVERLFAHDLPPDDLARWLGELSLDLVLFDAPAGDWIAGDRGLLCDPDRSEEFDDSIERAFTLAEQFGTRLVNVLAGIVPDTSTASRARAVAAERLATVAPAAHRRGLTVLVEAINRFDVPGYLLHDVRDAAALVRAIDHPAVGLQFDVYHVARGGLDPAAELASVIDLTRHVQVADVPGRGEPGSGSIAFGPVLDVLDESGFDGAVGLECIPTADTDDVITALRSRWGGRLVPHLGRT